MKFLYDISGGQNDVQPVNVFNNGTTPVKAGAAVMKGVTAATNNVQAIVATGALADILGVLEAPSSATDSSMTATPVNNFTKCCINPLAVYLAEYSQTTTNTVAATSASSGTTINLTSAENNSGGWLYISAGTDIGNLLYVVSQAGGAGTMTVRTAPAVALDATSYMVKVSPKLFETIGLDATAVFLKSTAAAGSGAARVLENFIRYNGQDLVPLDPTKHDALTGLNSLNVHLYSAIMFLDHFLNVSA